jgi:hypothetical protein
MHRNSYVNTFPVRVLIDCQRVSTELIHLMVLDGWNDVSSTGRRASDVRVGVPVEELYRGDQPKADSEL